MSRVCALLCLLLVLPLATVPPVATAANLPPTLRADADALIQEVANTPTNAGNRTERADRLWTWANAVALGGVKLPVHLTQIITYATNDKSATSAVDLQLDQAVAELAILDKTPDMLGTVSITPGPFVARSHAQITQQVTVGSRAIPPGGGLLIGRHFMSNFGEWQITEPRADNYLTITSSNPTVNFVAHRVQFPGMHGGFRGTAERIVFRVASGTLAPGDVVTITYGDQSQGSKGLLMPPTANEEMVLPLYLSFEQQGAFLGLPLQTVVISGGSLAGVAAFAPSVVGVDEPFTISVRGEDGRANRANGKMPGWKVFANDTPLTEIPAGNDAITVVDNLRLLSPGAWQIRVESLDGSIKGRGNPILVETAPTQRIYWGDTHGHSGFAEGLGSAEGFMRYARDDARLDYVTHSEHDVFMDDSEWEVLRQLVGKYSEEKKFIPFLGYEWTVDNRFGGHHNLLFRTPVDRQRFDGRRFPTLPRLHAAIRASTPLRDILAIPHAHNAGDWRLADPEITKLVEIMSMHGNFEWFGRMYLDQGHQVGFTAASDNHLSQPGYNAAAGGSQSQRGGLGAVFAPDKTTDAIFDALRGLRTYATTGERIILQFGVNGSPMGTRTPMNKTRKLSGRVIGTAPLESVSILKNDQLLWTQSYAGSDFRRGEPTQLAISFNSSAEPVNPRDNPRGYRPWVGTLEVTGATVVAGHVAANASTSLSAIKPEADGKWTFRTASRGAASTLVITLDEVKAGATMTLNIEGGVEFGGAPPIYRQHQKLDPATLQVRLTDLKGGAQVARIPAPDYQDEISVRRVASSGTFEASFDVEDSGTVEGDYYYVRVIQSNDALAWSSPVWVGGRAPQ